MKKILNMAVLVAVLVFSTVIINATSFSVSANKSTVAPGGTFQVNINVAGEGRFDIQVTNGSASISSFWYPEHKSVTITAGQSGTVSVKVIATSVSDTSAQAVTGSQTVSVGIVAPTTPAKPTPPPAKTPEQIAKEREEAAAAAEKLEKERLEAELIKRKNTPLINTIDVISRSDKRMDSSLIILSTEFEKFDYEFTLPKKVNTFDLEILSDQADVSVTYDVSHALTETETEKVIPITVTGPEFSQDFKLTVKKDTTPDSILSVAGKEMVVYSDDFFKDKMVEFGFVHNEYPLSDLLTSYYTFGDVNLQLLVDSEDNARWYTLDSEMQPIREVVLLVGEDKKPFFAYDTDDDDLVHQALHGGRYKSIPYVIDESLAAVDSGLKFKTDYMAWEFEGNHVVYGFDHTAKEGTYLIDGNQNAKFAVVAFDAETDNSTKTVAITSSVGLVTVSGYVLATTLMNIRKRKED